MLLITFASQVVVISAILYYFGYVHTQAMFEYFGVDTSLLGYTSTDYILGSINEVLPPIAGGVLVTLVLYGIHRWLVAPAADAELRSYRLRVFNGIKLASTGLGAVLIAVALTGPLWPKIGLEPTWRLPLTVVAAAIFLAYGAHLGRRRAGEASPLPARLAALLLTAGLVGTIWALAFYAQYLGAAAGLTKQESLRTEPEVVLYSTNRLEIAGSGVVAVPVLDASPYRFRYSGLRLLAHTAGKYILLPAQWQPGRDGAFLIQDNDSIRADMYTNTPQKP